MDSIRLFLSALCAPPITRHYLADPSTEAELAQEGIAVSVHES